MIALQDKTTLAAYVLADAMAAPLAEMQKLYERCAPETTDGWAFRMDRADYARLVHRPSTFCGIEIKINPIPGTH